MTRTRKIDLLYKKAKGQPFDATAEEKKELRKYHISAGEGSFYTTKANIGAYVTAVDRGTRTDFYDWCMNNHRADKRRRGSSKEAMKADNWMTSLAMMLVGWLIWGVAVYWIFNRMIPVGGCIVIALIISYFFSRVARAWGAFTLMIIPVVLAVVFGTVIWPRINAFH